MEDGRANIGLTAEFDLPYHIDDGVAVDPGLMFTVLVAWLYACYRRDRDEK